jgi:hypothetical protein
MAVQSLEGATPEPGNYVREPNYNPVHESIHTGAPPDMGMSPAEQYLGAIREAGRKGNRRDMFSGIVHGLAQRNLTGPKFRDIRSGARGMDLVRQMQMQREWLAFEKEQREQDAAAAKGQADLDWKQDERSYKRGRDIISDERYKAEQAAKKEAARLRREHELARDAAKRKPRGGGGGGGFRAPSAPRAATAEGLPDDLDVQGHALKYGDAANIPPNVRPLFQQLAQTRPGSKQRKELNKRIDNEYNNAKRSKERYETRINSGQLNVGLAKLRRVKSILDKIQRGGYPEQKGRYDGDVPGYGQTGTLHNRMISQGGRDLRGAMKSLLDTELRMATGAAAPPSEVATFEEIMGAGMFDSDEDLMRGLEQAEAKLLEQFGFAEGAATTPHAIDWYWSTGAAGQRPGAPSDWGKYTRAGGQQAPAAQTPEAPTGGSGTKLVKTQSGWVEREMSDAKAEELRRTKGWEIR